MSSSSDRLPQQPTTDRSPPPPHGERARVHSQLATEKRTGDAVTHSNIGHVVRDLGSARSASSGWLDAEQAKVSRWAQAESEKVLAHAKGIEAQLIAGAKEKQRALDAYHSEEIGRLVAEQDRRKASELKCLEDDLQRQMQATLTATKNEINTIESETNRKKMELLKHSQLLSAKEMDELSNLAVETKLTPSHTRTLIDTRTDTGNVVAIAKGGVISSGGAQAEAHESQRVEAAPNAGQVRQDTNVRGDAVRNESGRIVGDSARIDTNTEVAEEHGHGHRDDAAYEKHGEPKHDTSFMGKIKQAVGMEPKSSDVTKRK